MALGCRYGIASCWPRSDFVVHEPSSLAYGGTAPTRNLKCKTVGVYMASTVMIIQAVGPLSAV